MKREICKETAGQCDEERQTDRVMKRETPRQTRQQKQRQTRSVMKRDRQIG